MSCPEYSNQFGLTQYDGQCAFFVGVLLAPTTQDLHHQFPCRVNAH